ncbi:DNA alkylation repair protein [bacterium]|nr:MAG: DNA alkylation repair protein [bacterium]
MEMHKLADPSRAGFLQGFFKTGKGEYAEGDCFLGIRVPLLRRLAKQHKSLVLKDVAVLLKSKWHEERLTALIILSNAFLKNDEESRKIIFNLYVRYLSSVNNWDLVDISAPNIAGAFLWDKEKTLLYNLAKSKNIWERRAAIMATFYFIKRNSFNDALNIARLLLNDNEDLIHKATGWMLREVGKRSLETEKSFLDANVKIMPRTMLRYAIERFPEKDRSRYLEKTSK